MAKKNERVAREAIITDMNDFLMDYAAERLGKDPKLAQSVFAAAKDDLTGLDSLFKDDGVGRRTKYLEVASGFLHDEVQTAEADPNTDYDAESTALAKEAMAYLGNHAGDFDRWEEA